jgi:hypothetical protein
MSWISSIVVSILSGISGLLLAGFIANACVSWYHVPSREGASGFFVIFTALGGGIAGLVVGLITARIIAANYGPGFGREFGAALSVVLAIAGVAVLLCRFLADIPPEIEGRPLNLEVEFRFPTGANSASAPTADGEWKVRLGSLSGAIQRKYDEGEVKTNAARIQDGRWIVPTETLLFTERGKRVVTLRNGDKDTTGFWVPVPARPGKEFMEWSEWLPRQSADGQPWPGDKMSYRFRVQKQPPPPPLRTYADIHAEEMAQEEAEFAAMPTDAPLEQLMPYLDKNAQKERAQQKILNRPQLAKELANLALGENAEMAAQALYLMAKLPKPTAELIEPVQAVARDIAERIRKVNGTTVEADPSYMGAADISIRFNGWFEAVRTLRADCGGDFTPELKTILELSRVRRDSHAMQVDVCRVASFYMHEWTGLAPIPGDPKPR